MTGASLERLRRGSASSRILRRSQFFLQEDDRVGDGYGISGLPTTLLLDQQGRLASTWAGPVTQADLERLVAPLMGTG